MKTLKNYRHGEVGLIGIKSFPKGLKETKTNVLMNGSHGNSHSFDRENYISNKTGSYSDIW